MMNPSELLDLVDDRACLNFLASMVRHKSYPETVGERELAIFMHDAMTGLGLSSELQPVSGDRVNAIGRLPGLGGGKSLLFNGHLDTNPVTEGWTVDPLGGVVDDQFIYGIGVSNMKAGCAAYFCAVRTLLEAGVQLKGDLILTYVVGELQGGIGTVRAIEQGVRADYFINCEPTDLGAVTLHAGSLHFVIELEGTTRHMSKREEAVDAIAAACTLVPRLNGITFSGAESAEHRSVNRANIGVLRGALSRDFHDWRAPQVADFVRLAGSARSAPSQSEDSVFADLQAELDRLEAEFPGLETTVYPLQGDDRPRMSPFEVDQDSPIVRSINAAYAQVRGRSQPTGAIPPAAFFGTDAAHFSQRLSMEGVVCGPGGRYNTMPAERVDIPDYLDAVRIYLLAILETCETA